jgi:hypothetical protein
VKDGSKLACAIKKRFSNNMFSRTSNLYCFYNERSDDVRWDYENVLKISMLYHARLNVEYKINIAFFQNEETVLENFATTIDCYWIQCKRR